MIDSIEYLLRELKMGLARFEGKVFLYHVGSSVYRIDEDCVDVDVLVVNSGSGSRRFGREFDLLHEKFSCTDAPNYSIRATSDVVKLLFNSVTDRAAQQFPDVNFRSHFCIGPYRAEPVRCGRKRIDVHVCGDLSVWELSSFAERFPYIFLAFVSLNRCVLGPPLEDVVPPPSPNSDEYRNALSLTAMRGLRCEAVEGKAKALRKVFLIQELHNDLPDAYQRMEERMKKVRFVGSEIDKELKRVT